MIKTNRLTFVNAPKVLFDFEEESFNELTSLNINDWNVWQICKLAIFYNIIRGNANVALNKKKNKTQNTLVKGAFLVCSGVLSVLKILLHKKNAVFFVTSSADKLIKDKNGLYYNSLVYPILDEKIVNNHLIFESPSTEGFLKPSVYPYHVNSHVLSIIGRLLFTFGSSNNAHKISSSLSVLLNRYLIKSGFVDQVSATFIERVIRQFLIERKLYRLIFLLKKPSLIVSSEKMTTGFMAAAIELNVPIVELQHGAMDAYYPHYVWSEQFLKCKKVMKPNRLGLFGDLAQGIAVKSGYFKNEDIIKLGYYKIEILREKTVREDEQAKGRILVVMQPLMHDFNLKIIESLLKINLGNQIRIILKGHPLQAESEIQQYLSMMSNSPLEMAHKNDNIHELIRGSDIVVGYLSTTLEESISLGKAAITLTTPEAPRGIHTVTGQDVLQEAIRPVSFKELESTLHAFYSDRNYYKDWLIKVRSCQYAVYQRGYKENIRNLLGYYIK